MVMHATPEKTRSARLAFHDELTISKISQTRDTLINAFKTADTVTLDLSAVSRVDLAGLQLLYAARRTARDRSKTLQLVGTDNPAFATALNGNGFDLSRD